MSEIRIEIPVSRGLSDDELNRLTEAFRNQLIDTVSATQVSQAGVRARPAIVNRPKVMASPVVSKTIKVP